MIKLYEFETNRTNISEKQFFSYVKREFKRRTGEPFEWIEDFEYFSSPGKYQLCDIINTTTGEICKIQPDDIHLFLPEAYNFIMEWFDGHGYCYAVEYKR